MSTKRILTPTAIKEMMISWHQKGKSLKEIADLTGKPCSKYCSTLQEELLPLLENAYPDGNNTFLIMPLYMYQLKLGLG